MGDVPTVLAGFADDISGTKPRACPRRAVPRPRGSRRERLRPGHERLRRLHVTPEEILADGDRVVVLTTHKGTAKESGNKLSMPAAHVWTVRDGKVTYFRLLADSAAMNAALAVPATAA